MAKVRKILCSLEAPYIINLMSLIETQSKATLGNWGLSYAEENFLPIYEKSFTDGRPRAALAAAREWFAGNVKLPEVNRRNFAHAASIAHMNAQKWRRRYRRSQWRMSPTPQR